MSTVARFVGNGLSFVDSQVCNPDDAIYEGDYNPHNVRLWLLHDHGFVLCVVWADCLQDALDIAVDNDKLDRYLVTDDQASEYGVENIYDGESGLAYLGNASEPFDIGSLGYVEFAPPKLSLAALFTDAIKPLSVHYV